MALVIKWGAYTHVEGRTSFDMTRKTIFDETGESRRGIRETWRLKGVLIADGASAIATLKGALDAAYATGSKDLIIDQDGASRAELLTANCKGGTRVVDGPTYPDSRDGIWVTQLPFTITIEGDVFDGESVDSEIIELIERWTYDVAQDKKTTQRLSGRLRTIDGVSARDKANGRDPTTPENYQRMGWVVEINDVDDEATYEYRDWEYWKALPTNVTGGGYKTTRTTENNDAQRVVVTGSFTGVGAQTGADAAKLTTGYDVIREEQTVDEYTGTVSFTYSYFDQASSDELIFFRENITLQPSGTLFVLRPVLNVGVEPIKQDIAEHAARVVQSGSAIGATDYPDYPAYSLDSTYLNLKASSWNKQGPKPGPGGEKTEYGITWNFVFDLPTRTTVPDPHVIT